jgi:hypothetical protein
MKDEAPIGSPFIGEPRCGRPVNLGGRAASPCGQKLSNLSPRCGGWIKGKIVEGKEGKRGGRWPAGRP